MFVKRLSNLNEAEEKEWAGILLKAMGQEELVAYLGATSVAYALTEGGASPKLISTLVTKLQEKGGVPASIKLS